MDYSPLCRTLSLSINVYLSWQCQATCNTGGVTLHCVTIRPVGLNLALLGMVSVCAECPWYLVVYDKELGWMINWIKLDTEYQKLRNLMYKMKY